MGVALHRRPGRRATKLVGRPSSTLKALERFATHIRVPEGDLVGQPLELRDFQTDWMRRAFPANRKVRRAILSIGRKNGKTALIAFLVLAACCGPLARPFGEVISAARSKEQASQVFRYAKKMIEVSGLGWRFIVRDAKKELEDTITGVIYKAVSADAKLQLGAAPFMVIHDELGAVEGPRDELFAALESAMGAYEKGALEIIISTQAPSDADLLSILIDDALSGQDDTVACALYAADEDADPFVRETWDQANPALGVFRSLTDVEVQAARAARMPSQENSFRNLILNQRIQTVAEWMPASVWKRNQREPDVDLFTDGRPVYGGLDLSMRADLSALVLVCEGDDQDVHVQCRAWTPEDTLKERASRDRAPLDLWVEQGHLRACRGGYVDYRDICLELVEVGRSMNLALVEYDRYRMRELLRELEKLDAELDEGLPFLPDPGEDSYLEFRNCGQGFRSMTPALEATEHLAIDGRLRCGNHPVLNWCVSNATLRQDHALNRVLDKKRATGRIDLAVALAMAVRGLKIDSDEDSKLGADDVVFI